MKFSVTAVTFALLMTSTSSFAARLGRGTIPDGVARMGGSTPSAPYNPGATVVRPNPSANPVNCGPTSAGNFVSMDFLNTLMDYPSDFKVRQESETEAKIQVPRFVSACTQLKFVTATSGNHVFIRAMNDFEFTEENVDLKDGEDFSKLSHDEKYERCMVKKGLVTSSGEIDRAKALEQREVSTGGMSQKFNIDLGDKNQSLYVAMASPSATLYDGFNQADIGRSNPGWDCTVYENIQGDQPYRLFISDRDLAYDRAMQVCDSQDYQEILNELSRLRRSTAGNFNDLITILEKALDDARKKESDEIFKQMTEIEDQLKPTKEGSYPEESTVTELADKYKALAQKLHYVVLQPSIAKMDELLKSRTTQNADQIDRQVKSLNEEVARFSSRRDKGLAIVYGALKEHALTSQAKDIRAVELTSYYYGRVYKGRVDPKRGDQLSLQEADRNVVSKLTHFEDNDLRDWSNLYLAKSGSTRPITQTQTEISRLEQRMQGDYQKFMRNEQTKEQEYCGANMIGSMKNPIRCNNFRKGRQARLNSFLKRRQSGLVQMRTGQARLASYGDAYETALARREEAGVSSDPYSLYYETGDVYSTDFGSSFTMGGNQDMSLMMRGPASFNTNPFGGQAQTMPTFNGGFQMLPQQQQQPFMMPMY